MSGDTQHYNVNGFHKMFDMRTTSDDEQQVLADDHPVIRRQCFPVESDLREWTPQP